MSDRISPTAHYTGYTWFHHGLSHPALVTREGRLLHAALQPVAAISRRLGRPTLEGLLLARHHEIDEQLTQAIDSGAVGQVIEVAAGLSPRGWDFARRFGNRLAYVEADLPAMAQRKRQLLADAGLTTAAHRVVDLDALADDGPLSLARLADTLDPSKGLALITEGLLNYFPTEAVLDMWRRYASTLKRFPQGLYLSDLHLAADNRGRMVAMGTRLLSSFVRGRVHLHFDSPEAAVLALRGSGFDHAALIRPSPRPGKRGALDIAGARMVRVVHAGTDARL
ncbi:MAG: class I SAM-dependent methyltransferase [Panacagrimonas sp.]